LKCMEQTLTEPKKLKERIVQMHEKVKPIEAEKIRQEREQKLKKDSVESPISKQKYKVISKEIKELEKTSSFEQVMTATMQRMVSQAVPQKIHWRVYLDLADFAKRETKFQEAAALFKVVVATQPYAYQGWLEFAKMQEECGR